MHHEVRLILKNVKDVSRHNFVVEEQQKLLKRKFKEHGKNWQSTQKVKYAFSKTPMIDMTEVMCTLCNITSLARQPMPNKSFVI